MSTVCGIDYDPVQAAAIIGSFVIGVMFVIGIGWIKAAAHARREARIEEAIAQRIARYGLDDDEPEASAPTPAPTPAPAPVVVEPVDVAPPAALHQPKSIEQRLEEARARAKAKEQAQRKASAEVQAQTKKPWEANGATQDVTVRKIIIPG